MSETRIVLDGGKYTVVHDNGTNFHALRHGEVWRSLTGDGLILSMAYRIEELEQAVREIKEAHVFNTASLVPTQIHAICHRVLTNDQ